MNSFTSQPTTQAKGSCSCDEGGRSFVLEKWVTVRGNTGTVGGVTQAREKWLELPQFADATFWIDVAEVTAPTGGLVLLNIETSPSCDESLFQPATGLVSLTASTAPTLARS